MICLHRRSAEYRVELQRLGTELELQLRGRAQRKAYECLDTEAGSAGVGEGGSAQIDAVRVLPGKQVVLAERVLVERIESHYLRVERLRLEPVAVALLRQAHPI